MIPLKRTFFVGLVAAVLATFALWWHTAHKPEEASATAASSATSNTHPAESAGAMTSVIPTQKVDSVEVMVERLRARLEKEPNDVNGWVLLARSYHYLERWDDARAAFAKARALGYKGDSEAPTAGNSASDASAADGAVFADIGRVAQSGDNNSVGDNNNANATAADSARVRVAVDVAPELRAKFAPETTVFVFARAAQGPRMPLAVVRKTLSELPAEIDLDDSLAMMPEARISAVATIVFGARITPSGNPIAQPGDIEVLSTPLSDWHGQRVSLLLNEQK